MVEENKALQGLRNLETDEKERASADFPVLFVPAGANWSPALQAEDGIPLEP